MYTYEVKSGEKNTIHRKTIFFVIANKNIFITEIEYFLLQ